MTDEMARLVDAFGYGMDDLRWFTINAMKSAFLPFDERLAHHRRADQAGVRRAGRDVVTDDRVGPPLRGDERETLRAFLDYHRATLAMKCEGLSDEQLRERSSPPSTLSLLGLVRHMAEVERTWFRRVMNAEQVGMVWSEEENDFQRAYDATGSTRAEAFSAWAGRGRDLPAGRAARPTSLDVTAHQARWGEDVSLRLVMVHMIQEYARHNGHADLLREAVDGSVGA